MSPAIDMLAGGSRLALIRALDRSPRSSAPELAAATGLHLNTVRAHLKDLDSAGFVERQAESRGGRGRPTLRYRLRRDVAPRGDDFLALASLLGEALGNAGPKTSEIRAAGREWGRAWAQRAYAPSLALRDALEQLGFDVKFDRDRVRLRSCPCPLVAKDNPGTVCRLADAVADGVLEGSSLRVSRREHDPSRRSCTAILAPAG
jgi:predicted ArsR family transcriptional regulator